jgi:ferrous iron transport protein B
MTPGRAAAAIAALFGIPISAGYHVAAAAHAWIEPGLVAPVRARLGVLEADAPVLHAVLVGDYGLLTLGVASFVWALPVVALVAVALGVGDGTGGRARICAALDPWLARIGLRGGDLEPVLAGFGCNAVAVVQSRACDPCTRRACVALTAYGASCSYQLGAILSVLAAAGAPWLAAPLIALIFAVGVLHTRLWHGPRGGAAAPGRRQLALARAPAARSGGVAAVARRVRAVVREFLGGAMPLFLAICAAGALLAHVGALDALAAALAAPLGALGLPADAVPAVVASFVRKDGLLVIHHGDGAALAAMSAGQVLVLAYLAATLAACLVTLAAVARDLGGRAALALAGRQAVTSLVTAALLGVTARAAGAAA